MNLYKTSKGNVWIYNADSLDLYDSWESPIIIISDGPYGISGFEGDLPTSENLGKWYEPHIKKWSKNSTPQTTLWFWNTEIGWAKVHPFLEKHGWSFINCHVWNKGIAHIAGNSNTKSLRKLPIVTEICVQYCKKAFVKRGKTKRTIKEWLRDEWIRTGLPLSKTNEAAGVKDAATRKYFTKDHLYYPPPPDVFEKIVNYANKYGDKKGVPYFSFTGKESLTQYEWKKLRPKFFCPIGVTNVWNAPSLNGKERIKIGPKAFHLNQKPLDITELMIKISSEIDDVVWEPFGGLATGAVASYLLDRKCYCAEINPIIYNKAVERLSQIERNEKLKQSTLFTD